MPRIAPRSTQWTAVLGRKSTKRTGATLTIALHKGAATAPQGGGERSKWWAGVTCTVAAKPRECSIRGLRSAKVTLKVTR